LSCFAYEHAHSCCRCPRWHRHVYLVVDRTHGLAAWQSRYPRDSKRTEPHHCDAKQHRRQIRALYFPGLGVGENATRQQKNEAMKDLVMKYSNNHSGLLMYNPPVRSLAFVRLMTQISDAEPIIPYHV